MDRRDGFFQRAGAGGEADDFSFAEPFRSEVFGAFDVVDGEAGDPGGGGELEGVVTVASADYDEGIAFGDEFAQGVLAVFRGLADGVAEMHFALRSCAAESGDEGLDFFERLRGLGDDTVTLTRRQSGEVGFGFEDVRFGKIAGEAEDFDVAAFADDDGEVAELHERFELIVRVADERARSIRDAETGGTP